MSFEIGFTVLRRKGDDFIEDMAGLPTEETFSCGRTKLNRLWANLVDDNPLVFNPTYDGCYLHRNCQFLANRISDDDRRTHYRPFKTFKDKRVKACTKAESDFLKYIDDLQADVNRVEAKLNRLYEHADTSTSDERFQSAADRLADRLHNLHVQLLKLTQILANNDIDEDAYDDDQLPIAAIEDYLNAARIRTRLKDMDVVMLKKDVVVYAYCSY